MTGIGFVLMRKGTGFRISIVFCNHEWFETGVRRWDNAVVYNEDGTRHCPP